MKSYSDAIPSARTTEETNHLVKENLSAIHAVEERLDKVDAMNKRITVLVAISLAASLASLAVGVLRVLPL